MSSTFLGSSTMPLLGQAAKFNEQRMQVLQSNIANIETPGYKSRDLPQEAFQKAMKQAIQSLSSPSATPPSAAPISLSSIPFEIPFSLSSSPVGASHHDLAEHFAPSLFQAQTGPAPNITFNDGNDRGYEHQVTEMKKTKLMQGYVLELMRMQYAMLETVISERVS